MASSQSISESAGESQTAMLCQLCERDPKLKWKCLDCGLMMCQRCRDKVHPKFPSADDHTIVGIREIGRHETDPNQRPELTKIKCSSHGGQNCCLYCKTCRELVCQICIANIHNKHHFCEIIEEYNSQLEKLTTRKKEKQSRITNLVNSEQKLRQLEDSEEEIYDEVKQEIIEYIKALINVIKNHGRRLLDELDEKWEDFSNRVKTEKQNLEEKQNQIQEQIERINLLLHPNQAKDLFSNFDSLYNSPETNISPTNTPFHGVPKFVYEDITNISLLMGKLEDVTFQYNAKMKLEKQLETDLKQLTRVLSSPDNSLWISDSTSSVIQNLKSTEDSLRVISQFEVEVNDAELLPSCDLLISVAGSSNLKLIQFGSMDIKDSVYTVSPHRPMAVHMTRDNKIIVGALGTKTTFFASGTRPVKVMDQTGYQEKIFQNDKENKPLFTLPYRITSNCQSYIAVVDILSNDKKGRIVVLDQEGGVKNIYIGHPDVNNKNNPFKPAGITTTPSDNFIVTDMDTHTLHILNSEGEIITFLKTEEMGILRPQSLSFSTTGQLYIGCGSSEANTNKDNNNLFIVYIFLTLSRK